jgi:hypothetical protein
VEKKPNLITPLNSMDSGGDDNEILLDETENNNDDDEDDGNPVTTNPSYKTAPLITQSPRVGSPRPPHNDDYKQQVLKQLETFDNLVEKEDYIVSTWFVEEPFSSFSMNNGYSPPLEAQKTRTLNKKSPSSYKPVLHSKSPPSNIEDSISDDSDEEIDIGESTTEYNTLHFLVQAKSSGKYVYYFHWYMDQHPLILTIHEEIINQFSLIDDQYIKKSSLSPVILSFKETVRLVKFCSNHKKVKNNYFLMFYVSSPKIQSFFSFINNTFVKEQTGENIGYFTIPPKFSQWLLSVPSLKNKQEVQSYDYDQKDDQADSKEEAEKEWIVDHQLFQSSYPGHIFTYILYLSKQITPDIFALFSTWGLGSVSHIFQLLTTEKKKDQQQ